MKWQDRRSGSRIKEKGPTLVQRLEPGRYFIHGDGTLFHCRGTEQAPAKLVAEQVRDGEVREIDPSTRDSWYGLSGARATRIDSTSPETPPS